MHDVLTDVGSPFEIEQEALEALQEAAESHLLDVLMNANLLALHAQRITLLPKDIELALLLMRVKPKEFQPQHNDFHREEENSSGDDDPDFSVGSERSSSSSSSSSVHDTDEEEMEGEIATNEENKTS